MITDEERAELDALENEGYAGVEVDGVQVLQQRHVEITDEVVRNDRITFLQMKASFPTVGDVARYFASLTNTETTFVFADEEDVPSPCEFVTFAGFLEAFYQELI